MVSFLLLISVPNLSFWMNEREVEVVEFDVLSPDARSVRLQEMLDGGWRVDAITFDTCGFVQVEFSRYKRR